MLFNPSTTETFGNVNLEAMASGLPVVCADVPNSRTLVEQDRSGLLCAPTDPAAYAQAMLALAADPLARARMGAGAQTQSGAYRWSQILDQAVAIYGEAVCSPRLGAQATRAPRGAPAAFARYAVAQRD